MLLIDVFQGVDIYRLVFHPFAFVGTVVIGDLLPVIAVDTPTIEKSGTVGAHHALAECVEASAFLGRDYGVC